MNERGEDLTLPRLPRGAHVGIADVGSDKDQKAGVFLQLVLSEIARVLSHLNEHMLEIVLFRQCAHRPGNVGKDRLERELHALAEVVVDCDVLF